MAQRIILYDGVCNLCNSFVDFAQNRSPRNFFTFIPYQESQDLLLQYPQIPRDMSSMAYIENDTIYLYSDSTLKVCSYLSYPAYFLSWSRVLPKCIRDPAYRFVGRNRYKWFGTCQCSKSD
ncbi:unnamed protein product [Blepharisma stoltei]|uniref:Thiol-disulfide oxidoreductase DCC n=1 Tax=Blepharisma stoltei TaxID=1481888 RepID=A0AAU9JXQ3_9CILI|nr:unnamed protein product [Blepharisma stoltei]